MSDAFLRIEPTGIQAGRDFHLAFSPEREDPGNPDSKVAVIPKLVGGYTPACLEKAGERAEHPVHRTRRRGQHGHARLRREPRGRGAQ